MANARGPYRHGSPYRDMSDRLLSMSVHDFNGCWLWLGCRSRDGYGRITVWLTGTGQRRVMQAHRVAYEVFKGPIPPGHDLDHKRGCMRCCINPDHLTPRVWLDHRRDTIFRKKNPPHPFARAIQLSLQAVA